jgi:hypothetical protein
LERTTKRRLVDAAVALPSSIIRNWFRKVSRPIGSRRDRSRSFFRIETLEPRLLLSAGLLPGAGRSLLKGLDDFQAVLDSAKGNAGLRAILPVFNRSVAEVIDLGGPVETIAHATRSYFDDLAQSTTAGRAATLAATMGPVTTKMAGSVERFSLTVGLTFDPALYFQHGTCARSRYWWQSRNHNLSVTGQRSLPSPFGIGTVTTSGFRSRGHGPKPRPRPAACGRRRRHDCHQWYGHCEHHGIALRIGRPAVSPRPDCRRALPQRRCELHRGGRLQLLGDPPGPASRRFDEAALDECACSVGAFYLKATRSTQLALQHRGECHDFEVLSAD